MIIASEAAAAKHGLTPWARVVTMAAAGVAPRIMGVGPVEADRPPFAHTGLTITEMDIIELNEAFASQAIAPLRDSGVDPDDPRINPMAGRLRFVIRSACQAHKSS